MKPTSGHELELQVCWGSLLSALPITSFVCSLTFPFLLCLKEKKKMNKQQQQQKPRKQRNKKPCFFLLCPFSNLECLNVYLEDCLIIGSQARWEVVELCPYPIHLSESKARVGPHSTYNMLGLTQLHRDKGHASW